MGLSQGGTSVSSAYPAVSGGTEYEQTTTAAGMENYGSFGSASGLHGPAYSSMQGHHATIPLSSSPFHFSAGFFDSPGFGRGGGATPAPAPAPAPAPVPVGGGYGSLRGSGGMDTDLLALMNNDLYRMWSNDSWGIRGQIREGF